MQLRDVDFLKSGSATSSLGEDASLMDNVTSTNSLHPSQPKDDASIASSSTMADLSSNLKADARLRGFKHPPRLPQSHRPPYTVLNQSLKETRLVRIDHGQTEATGLVHLDLKIVKLDTHVPFGTRTEHMATQGERPAYNALSYTWEPRLPLQNIYIDSVPTMIGNNLYRFLHQLLGQNAHIKSEAQWWWIDALSIDQENEDEKSYHLPLMKDVFTACDFLFAWLGDDAVINKNLTTLANQPPTAETLAAVLTAPYFRRLWTVQEFVLPAITDIACQRAFFSCGSATMSLKDLFIYTKENRDELMDKEWYQGIGIYGIIRLFNWREKVSSRSSDEVWVRFPSREDNRAQSRQMTFFPLGHMLDSWCQMDCSDPHDKVASLLGFVPLHDHPKIDYTDSLLRTFMKTTLAIANANPLQLHVQSERKSHTDYCSSDALCRLAQAMGLTAILNKDFRRFAHSLDRQAEKSLRIRPSVSAYHWLEALLYCHRCHKLLFRKAGVWYENFGFLASFEPKKGFYRNVHLPASGRRAYLPNRQVVLAPDIEKERICHIHMIKDLPHNIDSVTIVEDWMNRPRQQRTLP